LSRKGIEDVERIAGVRRIQAASQATLIDLGGKTQGVARKRKREGAKKINALKKKDFTQIENAIFPASMSLQ